MFNSINLTRQAGAYAFPKLQRVAQSVPNSHGSHFLVTRSLRNIQFLSKYRPKSFAISGSHYIPNAYHGGKKLQSTTSQSQYELDRSSREAHLPAYEPPKAGFLSLLPSKAVPYGELSRLDKPAGTIYLFMPCLFSTLLAAPCTIPLVGPGQVLYTAGLFFSGALIMRGAGCTVNDLWDRNFDPHVERTRLRPIARGAVKPQAGLAWAAVQHLAGLAVLLQFPTECLWYGIPSLVLVGTYPLAKRVTHHPQVVLGLAFSWGAMMGFPALGVDLINSPELLMAAASLYFSCVCWTVLYDMIYAHMDAKDDARVGIKSIALRYFSNTKPVLRGLAAAQISLLALSGYVLGAGPLFYIGSCGGAAVTLETIIRRVDLASVSSCWWWFKNGCYFTGGAISSGLVLEYISALTTG